MDKRCPMTVHGPHRWHFVRELTKRHMDNSGPWYEYLGMFYFVCDRCGETKIVEKRDEK